MAEKMSVGDDARSKLQKVLSDFIRAQEERELFKWVDETCKMELNEVEKDILERKRTCLGEDSSLMEVGSNTQDNSPNGRALSFKMKGNGYFQLKNYEFAIVAYWTGILLQPLDQELLASLYNNLSAALFYLKHYGISLSHCLDALKIKPKYEKVLARKELCLQKLRESYDAVSPITKKIKTIGLCYSNKVCANRARIQSRERNKAEKRENNKLLIKTIRKHNYRFYRGNIDLANLMPRCGELKDHRVSLIDGRLVWPATMLYPDFGRVYFIQQFDENESFQDVICDLLQLSADCCKYLPEVFQVYFMKPRNMFRFGMRKTIKDILDLKDCVIHEGTPDLPVFVKSGKQELLFLDQNNQVNLG